MTSRRKVSGQVIALAFGFLTSVLGVIAWGIAPKALVEEVSPNYYMLYTPDGLRGVPLIPLVTILVGAATVGLASRNGLAMRLSLSFCLGLILTFATFLIRDGIIARVDKFGWPEGWLAYTYLPAFPPSPRAYLEGIIVFPFLVDWGFWSLLSGCLVFALSRKYLKV